MNTFYKKYILLSVIGFMTCFSTQSQTTLTLQPDAIGGKDAYLRSLGPSTNWGNHPDFLAHAWTNSGNPVKVRGIIDFDLSSIPAGAIVSTAELFLYAYNSNSNNTHSTQSGSNAASISRVTSAWNEATVNWNNQPTTTSQNQVILPASTSSSQDYTADLTALVQDMIDNPATSHGFLFKLLTEQHYRRMLFASSDHTDSSLRPKLVITYTDAPDEVDSCLTINTYGKSGKDAYLDYINLNSNYGSHADFAATAWTNSGNTAISRGIIDFDFSDIPSGSTINSANLSLYAYDSPSNGSHSTQSGSNAAVIKRVTSSWEENTVTWNNQPTTTSTNEVSLPASTTTLQDYDVDMTDLVQDVIDNPTTSFGFMFKLLTEQYYRRMLFASSDHSNEALHPTLEVCFTPPTSVSVVEETPKGLVLDIFPNPANDQITIDLQHLNQPLASVELINTSGQLVMKLVDNQKLIAFDVSELPQGLYVVKVNTEANSITQKVIID